MPTVSNARDPRRLLRIIFVCALGFMLSACAVVVVRPVNNATPPPPSVVAEVKLPFLYRPGSFQARLNDRDVTSQFTVANGSATGTLGGLIEGPYVLDVDGCWGFAVLFVTQPPYPTTGCTTARSSFNVVQPRLVITLPAATATAGDTLNATISATPPPDSPLTVTLTSSTAVASAGATTIVANAPSATRAVQAVQAGSTTLSAAAPGYTTGTAMLTIRPRLSQLTPSSGPPGTTVVASGAGFVSPSATFNNSPLSLSNATSSQFSFVIPAGSPGARNVVVTSNGQASTPLPFTVTAPPVAATMALFRSSSHGGNNLGSVEIIRFTPATPFSSSTFAMPIVVAARPSPGMQNVGLCQEGNRLARVGAGNVEVFTIGGTVANPTLTLVAETPLATPLTAVGSACVFTAAALVRGTDLGIDVLNAAVNPITRIGSTFAGGLSSIGTAVQAYGDTVFRAHTTGLETISIATPTTPVIQRNTIANMTGSSQGTALAWLVPGTTLIRGTDRGIDVIDVSTPTAPSRLGAANLNTGLSATGVAVAVAGTRVVRGTATGIEVFDVSNTAQPRRCFFRNADLSTTGVGVAVIGTVGFRATDDSIEAFDLSSALTAACPPQPDGSLIAAPVVRAVQIGTTGVALMPR